MLWDEPKIFFLERRYFFSIILSEFLKNRVALHLRWKKISDMDYHGEEKVDHLYYDGTLPLESLAEEVIAVPSAEEGYITEIDLSERHLLENLLLEGMGTKLTERQRTRLWLYCINGVTAAEIASFEGIAQQNVSKSIASAKKKLKKFLKNRV